MTASCQRCGSTYDQRRQQAGYVLCLPCGEGYATTWVKHTVVPLHKSNYIVTTDRNDLVGINNKGGLVR